MTNQIVVVEELEQKIDKDNGRGQDKHLKQHDRDIKEDLVVMQLRRRFQGQVRTKPGFVKRLGFKVPKSALNMFKGVSKAAKGIKIPIIGPLIVGITEFLSSGNLGKALFLSLGTALGELLGTAIPIPVVGTLLGGVIGMFVGDLLYELILGGGPEAALKKLKDAGMAILVQERLQQSG